MYRLLSIFVLLLLLAGCQSEVVKGRSDEVLKVEGVEASGSTNKLTVSTKQPAVIYRSVDLGATWNTFAQGIPTNATLSGIKQSADKIYVTTDYHGVFVSLAGKNNWTSLNSEELKGLDINCLEIADDRLILGTLSNGILIMIQKIYQKAMKYAGEQHSGQQVPGSTANYLLHISNVAMEVIMSHHNAPDFDLDYAIQVAILHDVIEDTDSTYQEVSELFGEEVARGVRALTKDENLPSKKDMMTDSLERINQERKEVGLVKLADRITNLQRPPSHWNPEKIKKYWQEAKLIADQLADKNVYLNNRLEERIKEYQQYYKTSI